MQKRVFLIHGWDGRPDNHWFPYLSLELKANGFDVSAPQMPHAAEPKVGEWLSFLREYVGKPDEQTYFVGHSLGCIAIARYLETLSPKSPSSHSPFHKGRGPLAVRDLKSSASLPALREQAGEDLGTSPPANWRAGFKKGGIKVGGCVFVAGFSGRINVPEIREFYELPFEPAKAKAHCDHFVMIFSDNDEYVPMERSLQMAKELGGKTILERGKGHFGTSDGVTALPSVLNALLKMSSE